MAFWGVCPHHLSPPYYRLGFRYPLTCYFVPPHMLALPVLDSDIWHLPSGLSLCKWVGWWSFKKDREEASNASLAISLDVSAQFFAFFFFKTFIENIREKPKIMEACDWFYMFHCVKDHSVLLWHLIQSGAWQAQIHAMWTYGACFFLLCSSCNFNHYL